MKIELELTKEQAKKFCEKYSVKPGEIKHVLMAYFAEDKESQYFRDFDKGNFNLDEFLLSKEIGELVIMRSNAETNKIRFKKNE